MTEPKELTSWDFPDTIQIPSGYDMTEMPDMTRDNFQILIENYNNLVVCFNKVCDMQGIIFLED